jgi:hypothetical protein
MDGLVEHYETQVAAMDLSSFDIQASAGCPMPAAPTDHVEDLGQWQYHGSFTATSCTTPGWAGQ